MKFLTINLIILLVIAWNRSTPQETQIFNSFLLNENLNHKQLVDVFKDEIRKDSSNTNSWLILGRLWENVFQYDSAAVAYQYAILTDSSCVRCKQLLAGVMTSKGMITQAINLYQEALALDSTNFTIRSQYARLLKRDSRFREAFEQFQMLNDSTNYYIWEQIGDCAMRIDSGTTAILAYMYSFELNPANMPLAIKLINGYVNSGVPALWVRPYAQEAYSHDSTYVPLIRAKGYLDFLDSDFKKAEQWLGKAHSMGDSSRFTLKFLGISQYHNGRFLQSATNLEKAYLIDPKEKVLNFVLAKALIEIGDRHKAIDILDYTEKLMTPDPEELEMLYASRATAYSRGQQYAQAIEQYKIAQEFNPKKISYYYELGMCYYYTKDYTNAKKYLSDYLDLANAIKKDEKSRIPHEYFVNRMLRRINEELFFTEG